MKFKDFLYEDVADEIKKGEDFINKQIEKMKETPTSDNANILR